ncbi:MAG: NCS2 family permease [Lachnospiraceae bacterium]|nr:NCS2 family permease [Lachnospiraceae bacterium]
MEKFFKLKENNTTVRTEIAAGLTTFFAMAYIVFVNPNQVAAGGGAGWLAALGADGAVLGQIWNAVYIASVLAAVIGTLLMAFVAKLPYAQACGMGLNAFFCTCFVSGAFFAGVDLITGYHSGLVIIFVSGLVFLLLSVTGLRTYIAKAMPDCLKKAIPAGIGLFIAFIGFQNAGIIQTNQYTLVQFVDINGAIKNGTFKETALPAIIALLGLLIIGILGKLKVKGNVIIGIIASTVLYYLFSWTVPSFDLGNVGQSFKDFGSVGIAGLFNGAAWTNAFTGAHVGSIFNAIMLIITFCLVDMFDTLGTLYGTAAQANMLDENGDPIRVDKAMLCDSAATVAGAVLGTSTCTTFVESSAGVAEGGRTGLTSVVTAICFAVCLFLSPLASIVPSAATASALIYVGVLMVKSFAKVDMDDLRSALPAFVALIMMPMTYSIANGIGLGSITYVIMTVCTGKYKKKDIVVTIISLLFVLKFLFVTM